jgi:protein TonB
MKSWLAFAALLLTLAPAQPRPSELTVARVRLVDAMAPGRSVEDRLDEIRRRIQATLVYPELARRQAQEGVVLVRFAIDGQGAPVDLETARASGHWLLDRAAERAVHDAAPLPYVWGRLEVPVHFALER